MLWNQNHRTAQEEEEKIVSVWSKVWDLFWRSCFFAGKIHVKLNTPYYREILSLSFSLADELERLSLHSHSTVQRVGTCVFCCWLVGRIPCSHSHVPLQDKIYTVTENREIAIIIIYTRHSEAKFDLITLHLVSLDALDNVL